MDKINITHYPVHYLFGELGSPFGPLLYITILHIILNLTSRLLPDKKEYYTNLFSLYHHRHRVRVLLCNFWSIDNYQK